MAGVIEENFRFLVQSFCNCFSVRTSLSSSVSHTCMACQNKRSSCPSGCRSFLAPASFWIIVTLFEPGVCITCAPSGCLFSCSNCSISSSTRGGDEGLDDDDGGGGGGRSMVVGFSWLTSLLSAATAVLVGAATLLGWLAVPP